MIKSKDSAERIISIKLASLDHLRALAIILVFIYHYGRIFPHPDWTNKYSKFGWTGVDLFFVLSGYLIASPIFANMKLQQPILVGEFYLKRFFRIIPAYLLVLFLYYFFPFLREHSALAPLWKYLSFTLNLGLDLQNQGTFSHAWSLCIEEQFYFLFPLILLALTRFNIVKMGAWLMLGLFVAGFFIRYDSEKQLVLPFLKEEGGWALWNKWVYYPTYCRLDGLLSGVGIAAMYQFRRSLMDRICYYGNGLLIIGIGILVIAYFLCLEEQSMLATVFGFPLVSLGYGLLVMGAISPNSILYRNKSILTAWLARLSYSAYLFHKMVVHLTQELLSRCAIDKYGNLMFILCILTTLGISLLMNKLVESPFLQLRDYILRKRKMGAEVG